MKKLVEKVAMDKKMGLSEAAHATTNAKATVTENEANDISIQSPISVLFNRMTGAWKRNVSQELRR